jgi:16S rRNA (uracil1498-N3)-methyltransferase
MARRVHLPAIVVGESTLPADQAHHVRDVLRLGEGDNVEVFDAMGRTASGVLSRVTPSQVRVEVKEITEAPANTFRLTVASALPKGTRADWMIEKLSELGVETFIPLRTTRSVVHPEGRNKLARWERIASESAKQCNRSGVLRINELTDVQTIVERARSPMWHLSTRQVPLLSEQIEQLEGSDLTLLIGPEGDWTPDEEIAFEKAGSKPLSLTESILRVETAAVTAAAIVMCSKQARR